MLNRWQRTIVDLRGNVVPYAQLQILREQTQSAPTIYRDKAGTEVIPNAIVTANQNGYAYFYAPADLYRIRSTQSSIDWRDVVLGSEAAQQLAQQALDNAVPTYETLSNMQADTSLPVPTFGRVVNDSTLVNNGYYVWTGTARKHAAYQNVRERDVSIDPAPSKIPRAAGDGVIREAWVEDLPFNYDQIYAQIWSARYPGIPAPSFYQEFGGGASLLNPRITFSRSGEATYIKNGKLLTAGIDEPVFERGGLRVWPSVTNLYTGNNSLVTDSSTQYGMDVSAAASIFEGKEAALYTTNGDRNIPYSVNPTTSLDTTKRYTHSIVVEIITDEDVRISLRGSKGGDNFDADWEGAKEALALMDGVEVISNRGPNNGLVLRFSAPAEPEVDSARFLVNINVEEDVVGEQVAVHHYQIEEGNTVGPMVWTEGSSETMPADNARIDGAAFSSIFNPNEGAVVFDVSHSWVSGGSAEILNIFDAAEGSVADFEVGASSAGALR